MARAVDGLLMGPDVEITSVVTDSRSAGAGSMFVALPGERTDGGLFVTEAFENGAAAALVRDGSDAPGPSVFVRSTGDAFLQLAADERRRMRGSRGRRDRGQRQDVHEGPGRRGRRRRSLIRTRAPVRSTTRWGCR